MLFSSSLKKALHLLVVGRRLLRPVGREALEGGVGEDRHRLAGVGSGGKWRAARSLVRTSSCVGAVSRKNGGPARPGPAPPSAAARRLASSSAATPTSPTRPRSARRCRRRAHPRDGVRAGGGAAGAVRTRPRRSENCARPTCSCAAASTRGSSRRTSTAPSSASSSICRRRAGARAQPDPAAPRAAARAVRVGVGAPDAGHWPAVDHAARRAGRHAARPDRAAAGRHVAAAGGGVAQRAARRARGVARAAGGRGARRSGDVPTGRRNADKKVTNKRIARGLVVHTLQAEGGAARAVSPLTWAFDNSFWLPDGGGEPPTPDALLARARDALGADGAAHTLAAPPTLLDAYTRPTDGRRARTHRFVYSSDTLALSRERALTAERARLRGHRAVRHRAPAHALAGGDRRRARGRDARRRRRRTVATARRLPPPRSPRRARAARRPAATRACAAAGAGRSRVGQNILQ